jgi:hypothetical protein
MDSEYFVFKTIMTALDLNMVGEQLRTFVMKSTGCTLQQFEQVYEQIQAAWNKSAS